MKSFFEALGDFLERVIPSDLTRAFWKNHEPRPGWRTSAAAESVADVKYICDTADKLILGYIANPDSLSLDQVFDGAYAIAESMLAKRKAYLSTFESRD